MHTKFLSEYLKGRNRAGEKIILKRILGKDCRKVRSEFMWLRVEASGRLL